MKNTKGVYEQTGDIKDGTKIKANSELMKELGMTKPTFYRYKNQIEKGC